MICKCKESEMLMTGIQEKGGEQKFMFCFIYLCSEVYATRIYLCIKGHNLLPLQIHLASLCLFQPQLLPGLQLASGRCNLTVPYPMPLSSHSSVSVSLLWFFRLSCRIEQPVARGGGHFEHVKHLCTGPSYFPASLLLFLALASRISILDRVCTLKPSSYALLSVAPRLRQFIAYLFF